MNILSAIQAWFARGNAATPMQPMHGSIPQTTLKIPMPAGVKPPAPNLTDPVDVVARTLWAEARGDGYSGMQAVANVITTRAKNPRWWGSGFVGVCLAPYQFSSWDADSSQRPLLLAVTTADADFVMARQIAQSAVAGTLPDITGGADSYYATSMPAPPAWAVANKFTVQIGRQRFYRVELPSLTV